MQDYFVIEHPGTAYYNRLANQFSDLLSYSLGMDSRPMIGEEDTLTLHLHKSGKLIEIGKFTSLPQEHTLKLYISVAT